jgi:hypothetical protein
MILGGGYVSTGVIVVVNNADTAIEVALATIAGAEEIMRAKVDQ